MQYVTDLHLHSKYSRAVSPQMTLQLMSDLAKQKGIQILSASDFTHPRWFKELASLLTETQEGLYRLKTDTISENGKQSLFMLSTEISCIYKQGNKLRRIHVLVFAPSLEVVEKINNELVKRGCNLTADGRPIIGLSAKSLLELLLEIDERCLLIPAHVWTPHFGLYGSASGFDSIEECFADLAPYIYGIETGLSSDPEMNWRMKELNNRSILSFSDAHSAPKMAREATVMELAEPTYEQVRQAIMAQGFKRDRGAKGDKNKKTFDSSVSSDPFVPSHIVYTIEFYPEEGKYHFSGHRNCNVHIEPRAIRQTGNMCPVCTKKLTEGVMFRVEELGGTDDLVTITYSDLGIQWFTDKSRHHPPYVKLVPLVEVIAESIGSSVSSKKSQALFMKLCQSFSDELTVILKTSLTEIAKIGGERLAEGIQKVRRGEITIEPGYDGVYGKVSIWQKEDQKRLTKEQMSLEL